MSLLYKFREYLLLPQRCMAFCLKLQGQVRDLNERVVKLESQDHPYTFDLQDPYTKGCTVCGGPSNAVHPAHKKGCPNYDFLSDPARPKGACTCRRLDSLEYSDA